MIWAPKSFLFCSMFYVKTFWNRDLKSLKHEEKYLISKTCKEGQKFICTQANIFTYTVDFNINLKIYLWICWNARILDFIFIKIYLFSSFPFFVGLEKDIFMKKFSNDDVKIN